MIKVEGGCNEVNYIYFTHFVRKKKGDLRSKKKSRMKKNR